MKAIRCSFKSLLMLIIISASACQLIHAQDIPVGTTRNGTFIWDGAQWIPAEDYAQPAQPYTDQVVYADSAPPPLPVYEQPPCPQPNLLWTPGYWAWAPMGYYWVPGTWVPAPYVGALWTPGYWGWMNGRFAFHGGYWGPQVGFYGGVNYGGGFMGVGFAGGTWNGGVFAYNTAVVRVNTTVIKNVYVNTTIVQQTTIINNTRVSYNGGPNGIQHQPAPEELAAAKQPHQAPTKFQRQAVSSAQNDQKNFAKNNGGRPANIALAQPLAAERHAAPSGFKPPAQRPVTQLARVQAPAATVAAVKTATTKTAAVVNARPQVQPIAKNAPTPAGKPVVAPENRPAPAPPAKSTLTPGTTAPKPEAPETRPAPAANRETRPAPTTAPGAETRPVAPASRPEAKPAPRPAEPAPKPEAKPAPRPETRPVAPAPRPEAKPAPKPAPKAAPRPRPREEEERPR